MAMKRVGTPKSQHIVDERAKTKAEAKAQIESAQTVPELREAVKILSKYVFGEDTN